MATFLTLTLFTRAPDQQRDVEKRSFGGFEQRPMTEQRYKQERVATLFALFLGVFNTNVFHMATLKTSRFAICVIK